MLLALPCFELPAWFASELYGKDHLEEVHKFSEGRGYSYYECLRRFGLEWFGRRSFFDQRGATGQALWMDLALAREAGQELHNDYVITAGPEFGIYSALQSGHLFVPISTTRIREEWDEILPSAAVRFVRILPTLLRVRDEIHQ